MQRGSLPGWLASGLALAFLCLSTPSPATAQAPRVGGTLIVVNKGAASASIVDVEHRPDPEDPAHR